MNDTRTIPSALVAFPSNPDTQSLREEGIVLGNRANSWLLWDPIVPPRGAIIKRVTLTGTQWWLVENVNYSYFPNLAKTTQHLLHQELQLGLLQTDGGFQYDSLPTVRDQLSLFKGTLQNDLTGFTTSGSVSSGDDGATLGTSSYLLTTFDEFLNGTVNFSYKPTSNGNTTIRWGSWSDSTQLEFRLNKTGSKVELYADGLTLCQEKAFSFTTNTTFDIEAQLDGYIARLYINDVLLISYDLRKFSDYAIKKPLTATDVKVLTNGSQNALISKFYLLEIL